LKNKFDGYPLLHLTIFYFQLWLIFTFCFGVLSAQSIFLYTEYYRKINMATSNNNNTASIGFEQQIWAAADILRGNMDAAEYKHVVLGLIFLKYISDKFEERYRELEADDDDVEDKDAYAEKNVFFVPPSARWSVICESAHKEEIGTVIDDAMRAIEKENKRLKDMLPKNYARGDLDKRRLGNVVDLFTNVQMIEHGTDKDILGRTYEYCLAKFAEQEGKRAGEFYTPSCVVRTLVEVLQPFKGRVYDPCCGSAGMFVQSADFVRNHSGNIRNISVYGQDANPTTRKMALMNLAIRGIEADLGGYNADTFHNDLHPTLKANFILANPPFNLSDWNDGSLNNDPRWKYGLPPSGNANFAWLQHMIHHLAPNGKIGMVLANGSLSSQSGGEGDIRRKIVEDDLVEGIIAMPTHLFYTTQIPVSLWFINRNKKQKGKTLFIDARKMGTMVNRRSREMTTEDIAKIADTFKAFNEGTLEDVKGFCSAVKTEEITKQDFILTPGRYVGIEEQEDDGEPFEEKMVRLTGELSEMFDRSHELEDEIRKRLRAIGYEM
jgi:type I restriction enzyme M protein